MAVQPDNAQLAPITEYQAWPFLGFPNAQKVRSEIIYNLKSTSSASLPKTTASSQLADPSQSCAKAIKDVETELSGLKVKERISDFIGGMSAMIARAELSKRTPKSGRACDILWKADEYPEATWTSGAFNMVSSHKPAEP